MLLFIVLYLKGKEFYFNNITKLKATEKGRRASRDRCYDPAHKKIIKKVTVLLIILIYANSKSISHLHRM